MSFRAQCHMYRDEDSVRTSHGTGSAGGEGVPNVGITLSPKP